MAILTRADMPQRVDVFGHVEAADANPAIGREARTLGQVRDISVQLAQLQNAADLMITNPERSPGRGFPGMVTSVIALCRAKAAVLRAAADGAAAAIDAAEQQYSGLADKAYPPG